MEIARDLQIPKVIVPNLPAHFSALGMLLADVRRDYVQTYYRPLGEADYDTLDGIYGELLDTGSRALDEAGVAEPARSYRLWMDLRYVGQEFWLQVPVTREEVLAADTGLIEARFAEIHDHRFGHAALDEPLELVNLRLTAIGTRPNIRFPSLKTSSADSLVGTRPVYLENAKKAVESAIYARSKLSAGQVIAGPAVIEEYASTTLLFEGDRLTVAETGELVIEVRPR